MTTPMNGSAAPVNGAAKQTGAPVNGTSATAAPPAPGATTGSDEVTKLRAELAAANERASRLEKKSKVDNIEMMKFRDEKKGLGAKLSEHGNFDKAFKAAGLSPADLINFKVNPEPVLKKVFGDSWYDRVVEMRLNGGAPTAEAVAAEIARARQETKEETLAEWRREQEENANKTKQAQEQREAQAREQLFNEAGAFLEKSGGDYPIFEGVPRAEVARAVAQVQENQFNKTGKILTAKEAADLLEANEIARAERVAGIEKYRGKLTEKLKPANTSPVVGARSAGSTQSEQRRTQPNDPTPKRSFRTDEERRAAIMAMKLPGE